MEDQNQTLLPVEEFEFTPFTLEAICDALQLHLQEYYAEVKVQIVDCPDLSVPPYNLATKGFGEGGTGLLDIGGPPYLIPLVDRAKVYDLAHIVPKYVGSKGFPKGWYVSGAAAGPWKSIGSNCEMVISMMIGKNGHVERNSSKVALTSNCTNPGESKEKTDVLVKHLDPHESGCAVLANVMVSSGHPGKVLDIKCNRRIDPNTNFTASIRNSLSRQFGSDSVGLGGIFMIKNANSKIHVMQDFSSNPLLTEEDVNNWLKFFEMSPPMLFQSVLVSTDPGLDLRTEHSHGWSLNGKSEGGHYHYDLNAETVEYQGYYAVAEKLWRIDRPITTHQLGR